MKKIGVWLILLSMTVLAGMNRDDTGIVTDTVTGLMWQDNYRDNNDEIPNLGWRDAIDYCEALTLGGHDDWRLPNIRELNSIVDLNRHDPALDPVFEHTESSNTSYYWSSTSMVDPTYNAWGIEFQNGDIDSWYKKVAKSEGIYGTYYYYVRCVRGGM